MEVMQIGGLLCHNAYKHKRLKLVLRILITSAILTSTQRDETMTRAEKKMYPLYNRIRPPPSPSVMPYPRIHQRLKTVQQDPQTDLFLAALTHVEQVARRWPVELMAPVVGCS